MSNLIRNLTYVAILAVTLNGAQNGYASEFKIDRERSSVNFVVEHAIGVNTGSVKEYSGAIDFDEKNFVIKSVEITFNVGSFTTNNKLRDDMLKKDEFFNAAAYPEMKLKTKGFENNILLADLTARGETKEIRLEYFVFGLNTDEKKKSRVAISLKGKINREDIGVFYNVKDEAGVAMLGTEIELLMMLEGVGK